MDVVKRMKRMLVREQGLAIARPPSFISIRFYQGPFPERPSRKRFQDWLNLARTDRETKALAPSKLLRAPSLNKDRGIFVSCDQPLSLFCSR